MSLQSQQLKKLGQRAARLQEREKSSAKKIAKVWAKVQRWTLMLYHEFLRDDVKIRAQSLSFLMIFSLLPLIAGGFFIFTILSQFGMVQDALQGMLSNFLSSIPLEHREFMNDYILRFKDAYLESLTKQSGTVGIFALLVLGWVGLQTFNNIDVTLNHLWSADRSRPFWEKARNFIVVAVVAPIVLTGGFSIPIILQRMPVTGYFFKQFPLLSVLLNYLVPFSLILLTFLCMYRFVPVRKVWWKSAFWGALFATVCLQLTQVLMHYYFAFGTVSAYGKAAAVPLVGFWIYLLWIVVILGAEVSFLVQNGREVFVVDHPEPTFGEGKALLVALGCLQAAHRAGTGGVRLDLLTEKVDIPLVKLRLVLKFLVREGIAAPIATTADEPATYVLARSTEELSVAEILRSYYSPSLRPGNGSLDKLWNKSLLTWIDSFEKIPPAKLNT